MGAVARAVILGLATDEEHQGDRDEGGDQRDDEECRGLESGELLLEGVMPETRGDDGGGAECASRGGHGGGCKNDARGCRSRLLGAD